MQFREHGEAERNRKAISDVTPDSNFRSGLRGGRDTPPEARHLYAFVLVTGRRDCFIIHGVDRAEICPFLKAERVGDARTSLAYISFK